MYVLKSFFPEITRLERKNSDNKMNELNTSLKIKRYNLFEYRKARSSISPRVTGK